MKAETALITINGVVTFKALLIPETENELEFLHALKKVDISKLSGLLSLFTSVPRGPVEPLG